MDGIMSAWMHERTDVCVHVHDGMCARRYNLWGMYMCMLVCSSAGMVGRPSVQSMGNSLCRLM